MGSSRGPGSRPAPAGPGPPPAVASAPGTGSEATLVLAARPVGVRVYTIYVARACLSREASYRSICVMLRVESKQPGQWAREL